MPILIHFHQSDYRTFKAYYTQYVAVHLRAEFPALVSYTRFIDLIPSVLVPLCAYLQACRATCRALSFMDSTPLATGHNWRFGQHRIFADLAPAREELDGVVLYLQAVSGGQRAWRTPRPAY